MKIVGDMIVSLYNMPDVKILKDIKISKAFVSDMDEIMKFIDNELPNEQGWKKEIQYSLMQSPIKVVIATKNNELLGFACYDASAKGFFGPIGVKQSERKKGVGKALLVNTLNYMKSDGYAYAIIGWVGLADKFYEKSVGAKRLPDSTPDKSIYSNKINLKF